MESSRRHLLNDVAELRSMLKNNENTFYPRFSVTRKTGVAFPKTGVLFFTLKAIWRENTLQETRVTFKIEIMGVLFAGDAKNKIPGANHPRSDRTNSEAYSSSEFEFRTFSLN